MSELRVSLFGDVRVIHVGHGTELKVIHTVQALLAFLLIHRHRRHAREVLVDLFWGEHDHERARHCLNTTLWRLRRVLEPAGIAHDTYLVTSGSGEIGFNCASIFWLDVAVFEETVQEFITRPIETISPTDVERLEAALQLYTGELLEGFYDDWALRERERLRMLYLNSLVWLMRFYRQQGNHEQSLGCGQKIVRLDPLREDIHREIMRLYLESGQRALAVQQYEVCRSLLASELGIPPMAETQLLYNQMSAASDSNPFINTTDIYTILLQTLKRLHLTRQEFDSAHEQLERSIQLIEQLTARRE